MTEKAPTQIGPYVILEALGEGGMGAVFRAKHEDTGTIVALKTVRVPKQTLLNNLRREIHTMSRIEHPGIVKIVEQGMEDVRPWYAMELVEGMSLRQFVFGDDAPPASHSARSQASQASASTRVPTPTASAPHNTQEPPLQGPAALLSTAILRLLGEVPEEEKPNWEAELGTEDAFLPGAGKLPAGPQETGRWWSHALATSARLDALPPMSLPESLLPPKEPPATDAFGVPVGPKVSEQTNDIPPVPATLPKLSATPEVASVPNDDKDDLEEAQTMLEMSPFAALVQSGLLPGESPGLPEEDTPTDGSMSSEQLPASGLGTSAEGDTMLEMSPFASMALPKERIDEQTLQRALQLIWRLCEPLAYLHGEGIVHCDLKPDNILIREDGSPVLIDFGLLATFAGSFNREVVDLTLAGLGTIPYMAPEQINGQLIDARTDVYALGCILYEMLTGEPPFVGDWTELIGHHLFTEPAPPSTHKAGIPPEVDQLVLGMLAKEPRERTGHVDVVRAAIARWLPDGIVEGMSLAQGGDRPAPRIYLFRPELVGRSRELDSLKQHIDTLKGGGHGLVMISGESGVGKTRLTLDLGLYARSKGMQVLAGECGSHEGAPFEVFQPFFLAVQDRIRELGKTAQAELLGEHGRWLFPYAKGLIARDEEGESAASLPEDDALPPSEKRMKVFRALGQALSGFAQKAPLLLLLDDLHHADSLTLEALTYLARMRDLTGVLIVGTFRSEEAKVGLHLLCTHEAVSKLELERLDGEAVGAMVRDMLAQPAVSEGFISYLARQSEGNPFFIAEYLRAAVEEGLVWRGDDGKWQISPMYEEASARGDGSLLLLPSSLQQLVERRLQEIPPQAMSLLEMAAVLGREISFHLLKLMMEVSSETMWSLIEALRRREVLEYRFDGTLYFVHDKIREIVYKRLDKVRQEQLHRKAAHACETLYRSDLTQHAPQIGWHWSQAGELLQAQRYYKRGAKTARARGASDEAIRLLEAYLELDTPPQQDRIDVLLALGRLLKMQHRFEEAREQFVQSQAHAHQLILPRLEAKSQSLLAALDWSRGSGELARQHYESALRLYRQQEDFERAGWAVYRLAQLLIATENFADAMLLIDAEITQQRARGQEELVGALLGCLAQVLRQEGAFEQAEKTFQEALTILRQSGNRSLEAKYLLHYLILKRWIGEPSHTLEAGLARAEELIDAASHKPPKNAAYVEDDHFSLLTAMLCEKGHVGLLAGKSAEHRIKQVEHIARQAGLPLIEGTTNGNVVSALRRAQEAFLSGDVALKSGQHPEDMPAEV